MLKKLLVILLCASLLIIGAWLIFVRFYGSQPMAERYYSRYFKDSRNERNRNVIVFVHGFTGDSVSTWKNETANAYWPELISKDPCFAGTDIYLFNYPTRIVGNNISIDALANTLKQDLQNDKVLNYDNIIFICHSMGGLITRDFLLKFQGQEFTKHVKCLFFFGTPGKGTLVSFLGNLVLLNPQLKGMQPSVPGDYLETQISYWLSADFKNIPSFCAYETVLTNGVMVVDKDSAIVTGNKTEASIPANHIEMVQPATTKSASYRFVQNAFAQLIGCGPNAEEMRRPWRKIDASSPDKLPSELEPIKNAILALEDPLSASVRSHLTKLQEQKEFPKGWGDRDVYESPEFSPKDVPLSLSTGEAKDVLIGVYLIGLDPKPFVCQEIDRIGPIVQIDPKNVTAQRSIVVVMAFPYSKTGCEVLDRAELPSIFENINK